MKKVITIIALSIISCSNNQHNIVDASIDDSHNISDSGYNEINAQDANKKCPDDMVEIDGSYCDQISMFHCIKGGKNHLHQKDDSPMPYYCDEYKQEEIKCIGKEHPIHYCMDKYEYPNKIGELPIVMVDFYDAERICKENGKELCRDDQWITACEGPEHFPYTTGFIRDKALCNIDNTYIEPNMSVFAGKNQKAIDEEVKRLWQGWEIGRTTCKSPYGTFDMNGNVDEATVNYTNNYKPYKLAYHSGHWSNGARARCRPATLSHNEYMKWYCQSFRCCKWL